VQTVDPGEGPKVQGTELPWEINLDYGIYFTVYQSGPSSHHAQNFELGFPKKAS